MAFSFRTRFRSILFPVARALFRAIPMSQPRRDLLRNGLLDRYAHLVPQPSRGKAPALAAPRRPLLRAVAPAIGHVAYRTEALPAPLPARLIAFYLPQFHPIAENDAWWGTGFTEWRNVANALPQFEGHWQPRIPADLGYYDLRQPEVMHRQAKLAREYGIEGFCFYFYWFGGRTLLETPLQQWLADPSLDMPLCLCWANERWARNWDGRAGVTLIDQQHSAQDDMAFIAHIAPYLRDPRYLRVEGKPMLLVYRPGLLPDAGATTRRWRTWCRENGIGDIHLAYVQGFERPDPRKIGFDAAIEFPPNLASPQNLTAQQRLINPDYSGSVLDWRELARESAARPLPDYPLYPGANPGWDNEPRRAGHGRTYLHASPRSYRDWLRTTIHARLSHAPDAQRMVFINAWNEWAEGAVLEPDLRLGHAWLQATRDALRQAVPATRGPHVVVHAWYLDAFDEIVHALEASAIPWRVIVTTSPEREAAVQARLQSSRLSWELEVFENRGRDILPFLRIADRLLDAGVEVILKLHTKRSTHREDGAHWMAELLSSLLDRSSEGTALARFADEPRLGLLAPDGHLLQVSDYIGANAEALDFVCARSGVPNTLWRQGAFASGSMFWVRLEALRPALDALWTAEEFEQERGQIDGTLAHAMERMVNTWVHYAGYHTRTMGELSGNPPQGPSRDYRYARRG
jgi:lipopolysaccharide biosynthesis protein